MIGSERESLRGQSKALQSVTEALTEVKPARIGYFTIRGNREGNPLGYRCAGVNPTVAVAVTVDLLGRHEPIIPTAPRGLQQRPVNPLHHLPQLSELVPGRKFNLLFPGRRAPGTSLGDRG